jgi:two-component system catabolic regulation response regulator CreB
MPARILLLEDEPSIADNLIYALRSEAFDVTHVGLARDALSAFASDGADLVVLDIGVPDGNGLDVYRSLRQQSDVPVIFLTARSSELDRVLGLELGADDYVTKPFSPREVCARIKSILRRTGQTQVVVPAGPWRLDEVAQQVFHQGCSLNLTRYEYQLMATLMRRPGRIFGRSELMDLIWQDAVDTSERTVDAHIKLLRAKLRGAAADPNALQTHRHMGYSFKG